MDQRTDQDLTSQAIDALEMSLATCNVEIDGDYFNFDKDKIISAYFESRDIINSNPEDLNLINLANAVFYTSVRLTRCLYLNDKNAKNTIINGNVTVLNAQSLYDNLARNYKDLKTILEQVYP